jgi:hypothetical protein
MLYMVTFTINIPQMLAYIPYMDPMGNTTIFLILNSTSPDLQRRRERSARRGPVRCGAIGALVRLGVWRITPWPIWLGGE